MNGGNGAIVEEKKEKKARTERLKRQRPEGEMDDIKLEVEPLFFAHCVIAPRQLRTTIFDRYDGFAFLLVFYMRACNFLARSLAISHMALRGSVPSPSPTLLRHSPG